MKKCIAIIMILTCCFLGANIILPANTFALSKTYSASYSVNSYVDLLYCQLGGGDESSDIWVGDPVSKLPRRAILAFDDYDNFFYGNNNVEITNVRLMVYVKDSASSSSTFEVYDVSNQNLEDQFNFCVYYNWVDPARMIGYRNGGVPTGWQNLLSTVDTTYFKNHFIELPNLLQALQLGILESGDNNDEIIFYGVPSSYAPYLVIDYNDITPSETLPNTWTPKNNFMGVARDNAVGFSIGNKGYIGTGYGDTANIKNDFWEYDPAANTWTQKANFSGTERYRAVGFSIGSKGFVGTGYTRSGAYGISLNDFWEYDPATNTWTPKANFEGTARGAAVGFSIGSKGYIGTGCDGSQRSDFWEYDPVADKWTQKAAFEGGGTCQGVGFSIGSKGYIGHLEDNFWEYDPVADKWTQKANLGAATRLDAVGFSIGNKGYIGTGWNEMTLSKYNDFWEYDPAANTWTPKANFGGTARESAVGFAIGGKGYIGTGLDGSSYKDDFWEYTPDETTVPTVTITSPTSETTWSTTTTPLTISGTSYDAIGVTTVTWTNSLTGGSGSCSGSGTGIINWNCNSIALTDGTNNITITASDAANNHGTDTLVVTYTPSCDTTPDAFTFADQTGVALNKLITSNLISINGVTCATYISITGGTYAINGGAYTSESGMVNNGDTVTLQVTSSAGNTTTTDATLTIGGVSDTFSVTTLSALTTFTTGVYENNANISETLSIPGAAALTVTVTGNTEAGYDLINIYDSSNVLLRSLSGSGINETFTVIGSSINLTFTSDNSITASGVTVTISDIVNGACGSSDGGTFTSAPVADLCSSGNANPSSLTGSGPWTWSCEGSNGGTDASCSAQAALTGGVQKIIYSKQEASGNYDLWMVDTDGSNNERLTDEAKEGISSSYPSIFPNGEKILYQRGYNIAVLDIQTRGITALTTDGAEGSYAYSSPRLSANGTKITYSYGLSVGGSCDACTTWDIYIMDADGNNKIRMTENSYRDTDPIFSPDGTKLLITHYQDASSSDCCNATNVYTMDIATKTETLLYGSSGYDWGHDWNATGILFTTEDSGLARINPDGTGLTTILDNTKMASYGIFSPEGNKILYQSNLGGSYDLYTVYADGSTIAQITTGINTTGWPAWGYIRPAGATLPAVTSATSSTVDGTYGAGSEINFTLNFNEAVSSAGLTVTMNTGAVITTGAFNNVTSWSWTYTIAAGDTTADLTITSISGVITNGASNSTTDPVVPAGQNIGDGKAIVISANGVCGSSDGGTFVTAPTTNLCYDDSTPLINGTGPWNWTCAGQNGGSDAACMALSCDTTPDAFTFTDRTGVAPSIVITSNTITVSGINAVASISITGGSYSINGGAYTTEGGMINNGDTVTVQMTSSASYSATTDAILTIGSVSNTFSVTTQVTPVANTWMQKSDFGGAERSGAVGFSVGTKGYIGTGYIGANLSKDFWEYDPATNIWTQKADFGGAARYGAVGFSIECKGYIGTGAYSTGAFKDFWEYDPATNIWTQKADFGGTARYGAVGFSITSKGYVGTGVDGNILRDFWEYNPATNIWTQKADFEGIARLTAVGFSIGNKGYLGTGYDGTSYHKDFWEYDPAINSWIQRADFGGVARLNAVGFSIGNKGYLGIGINLKDFWEYNPGQESLYATYPDAGIWKNDGSNWSQITTGTPQMMATSGTDLYATFAGGGIWKYNGTDWSQATSNNPDKMVVSGTTLYGTFTGNGIWKFDGTEWNQVTSNNPDEMVIAGGSLYGTFGTSGVWKYDGSDWSQVTTNTPAQMVGTTNALYGIFAGDGIWKYEGSAWTQVTSNTPEQLISGGTNLYGTFAGSGIWKYNGTNWSNVTPNNPQQMTATSTTLYGVFTGTGIWKHDGTSWSQVTANDPLKMVAGE